MNAVMTQKYCPKYDTFINGCRNRECTYWNKEKDDACTFSRFHKTIENAVKQEFQASCDEARKFARLLLLNTFQQNKINKR